MAMYASHAEKLRVYREADREKHNRVRREWAKANPEKVSQSNKKWRDGASEEQKEKFRLNWRVKASKRKTASGSHSVDDLVRIRMAQKDRCALCRANLKRCGHLDHIMPLSRGGSNNPSNLQWLCAPCNLSKGAKDPLEYAWTKGFLL